MLRTAGKGTLWWCAGGNWCHKLSSLVIVVSIGNCGLFAWLQPAGKSPSEGAVKSKVPTFANLPTGWSVVKEVEVGPNQLGQFSQKLQVPLASLFNTFLVRKGETIQINTIVARNETDAPRLKKAIEKSHSNSRLVVQNGTAVYELVARTVPQMRLAMSARYALGLVPSKMNYRVEFDAIPIARELEGIGPDDRNQLFNLILQSRNSAQHAARIKELAKRLEFAREIPLVSNLQSGVTAKWSVVGIAEWQGREGDEVRIMSTTKPDPFLNMPSMHLVGEIRIDATARRVPKASFEQTTCLGPSPRFPVDAPQIKSISESIIQPSNTDSEKLEALLSWCSNPANIRYDGLTGSRYGTLKVVEQKFGRCMDYADLFITLARSSGLPSREVFGWLYESEGHVWCDVLVDGQWRMVDPTSGTICGSDYLPFCVSESGEFPLLYSSMVRIEPREK